MWKSPWIRWSIILGFASGGFLDGILLHQILQWHHLLSLARGLTDLRLQVLWDGYFHASMYLIAMVALTGLWRAVRGNREAGNPHLLGPLMIGFGLWHIADGLLSHGLLGIHRVKLDSPHPLSWDLLWFSVFGLLPLIVGWRVVRPSGIPRLVRLRARLFVLTALTLSTAALSLRPPINQAFTTVVFRPDVSQQEVLATLAATDARLVWADPTMGVVVVDVAAGRRWAFYASGALLVSGSGVPAACLNWSKT